MKKITYLIATLTPTFVLVLPAVMLAASSGLTEEGGGSDNGFAKLVAGVIALINGYLIPFIIALAVLAFVYGVFTYFIAGGADEDKRKEGRSLMLYAIIGFVAIVALWGIVQFVAEAFGFGLDATYEGGIKTKGPTPGSS